MEDDYLREQLNLESNSLLHQYLKDSYEHFTLADYVDYVALNDNMTALCHINRNGNKIELSYDDLRKKSNQMANYLKNKGVKKGDVVALILRNNIEFFLLVLAIQKLGGVVLPMQYMNKKNQYKSVFDRAKPSCIIAEDYELKQGNNSCFVLDEIDKSENNDAIKLCVNKNSEFSAGWEDLQDYQQYPTEFTKEDVNIYDLGYLFATSGTTGQPKLVMHNYGMALANYITGQWYGVKKGEKHYTICDSSWAMASWNMSAVLLHQGVLYINDYDRFNAEELLKCINDEKIYSLCAPRSMLTQLIEVLKRKPELYKTNIQSLSSAGEHLTDCDKEVIKNYFKTPLKEGYGMTEVVLPLYESSPGIWVKSPLYHDVRLVVPTGFEDPEILVYGDKLGLLMGYLISKGKEIEYSKPPVVDNQTIWHTSDIGRLDKKGNIRCDKRYGDTVKINDCLISMGDVEEVIKTHPMVRECVVESVSDELSGNALIANVELYNDAKEITEDDIRNYVKLYMQNYYRPKFVNFKQIERTLNGKPIHHTSSSVPDKNMTLVRKKHQ